IAGRSHTDLEGIIGMFVNTLVPRNFPAGQKSFIQFLEEVKERTLKSFENQDYQYEDLVENVVVERDVSRNPLFDSMLALQNLEIREMRIPGLTLTPVPFESRIAKFDLTLGCMEMDDHLSCNLEYSTGLFKHETIQRFIGYFKRIVSSVAVSNDIKISGIEIITEEEKQQLLVEFNATAVDYPGDKTTHQLFEEQAGKCPGHLALTGQYDASVTYGELNKRSDDLARHLMGKGVTGGSIVGIMMKRSLEMVTGIYGILKAGAAYLPIDPNYPEERIEFMLKDSAVTVIVTDGLKVNGLDGLIVKRLNGSSEPTNQPINQPTNKPTNIAYIIYTSGSTGMPKGVMVEHSPLVNRLYWTQETYNFDRNDVNLQLTVFTFDVSVEEL
ncbi:MAG: AMP-binding protein, partial [bacterium]|nr:AMP-binding protein [bacterium]